MWWYPSQFFLLMQGGAAPTDATQTDTLTVSDAVTATTLAAVPTESLTLSSETRTGTVAVSATESLAVSEVAFGALTSSNQVATDSAAVSESSQAFAAVSQADSATVTESIGAIPVVASKTDSAAISDSGVGFAAVNATDSLGVTESIGTTTTTGANISASDTLVLSESIVATLIAAAIESATISDTVAPVGIIATLETLMITEDGSIIAPFVGFASGSVSLGPRIRLTPYAGAATVTMDSTLITFDSTLTTMDGGYLADLPGSLGIVPRLDVVEALLEARMDAALGLEV